MGKIVIAIDGNSGCGKSTTAKILAKELGYTYVDTGAMYRATTLYFLNHNVSYTKEVNLKEALSNLEISFKVIDGKNTTFLGGVNVENDIRDLRVANKVSQVAALPEVRLYLVDLQRKMGEAKGVVMDGRDIGTNVFPNAELKVFMTAAVEVRAARRKKELEAGGQVVDMVEIINNLKQRDHLDTTRKENPLKKALGAIEIDTSYLNIKDQVNLIKRHINL